MKTSPGIQRKSLLSYGLSTLVFIQIAWISVSGMGIPTVNHKPDLLKSIRQNKALPDSTLEELFNPSSGQWEKSRIIRYTYNPDGLELQKFYDSPNDADDSMYEYTYDAAGILILTLRSSWDTTTLQWIGDQKHENTLDAKGNVISRVGYYWDDYDSLWQNWRKYEYTYDTAGNIMQVLFIIWDEDKDQWRNYDKTDYTRDENGKAISFIWQQWNKSNSQWYDAFSMEYAYDAEGREIQQLQYIRDTLAGQWINLYKYDNSWNAEGKLLSEQEYKWDTITCRWVNYEKTEYTYDINGNSTLEIGYNWDKDAGQWIGDYRLTHFYSGSGSTKMSAMEASVISVFPNPADDYIEFNLEQSSCHATFELYDMQGRKVLSWQPHGSDPQVPVSHLKNGIYLYVIYGNRKITGKVAIGR